MAIDIREFDGRHESAILKLHQEVFGAVDQEYYNGNTRRKVKNILRKGRSAIAIEGRRIIGLGLSASVGNMPIDHGKTTQEGLGAYLAWAKVPDQSEGLKKILANSWKHEVNVGTYSNQFIRSTDQVQKSDWYMDGLAVSPESRGQGIGRLLTEQRLEFAREESASAVYATLHLKGKGIGRIYTDLGFSPFLKITPAYSDGSATKYVGKKI